LPQALSLAHHIAFSGTVRRGEVNMRKEPIMFFDRKNVMMTAVAVAATLVVIVQIRAFGLGHRAFGQADQGSSTQALFGLAFPEDGPFPSDWFTVPDHTNNTHRRVFLPLPDCGTYVSDCEALAVLNELDGFNLRPRSSIPFSGPIDPTTVTSDTVFLVSLGTTGPGQDSMPWGTVVGIDQVVWDPFTNTLHVESDVVLAQHTRFALIVTRGIRDGAGAPIEASDAFRRFRANVRGEYKQALLDAIRAAAKTGLREDDIAVANVFSTQSATAVLERIRDQIHGATPAPADFRIGRNGERTVFNLSEVTGISSCPQKSGSSTNCTPAPIDLSMARTDVGVVAFGRYVSPDYEVHPLQYIPPVGTRDGTPAVQGMNDIYFNLFLPSGPRPVNGWPVAIFGHGINGDKNGPPLNVVGSMARHGIATIAINMVGHGFGPQSTLTVSRAGGTTTFLAGGRGIDQNGDGAIANAEGLNAARPRDVVFASDGFRQTAADLMQLVRVIEVGMDMDGDGCPDVDASRIYYFGISYGGAYGTIFLATEPNVRAGVLSAPADPIAIGTLGLANRAVVGAMLDSRQPSLLNFPGITSLAGRALVAPPIGGPFYFDDNMPLRTQLPLAVGLADSATRVVQSPVTNTVIGAMAIQDTIEHGEWVSEAGSPAAYAPHLRKAPLAGMPAKSVLYLIAKGDETAPNPTTTTTLRAGDLADVTVYYRHDLYRGLNPSLPTNPHSFATSVGNAAFRPIALGVQDMAATLFVKDGGPVTGPEPHQFFEFPIKLPLPEGLNYIIPNP
jgi:hypothetical protein